MCEFLVDVFDVDGAVCVVYEAMLSRTPLGVLEITV